MFVHVKKKKKLHLYIIQKHGKALVSTSELVKLSAVRLIIQSVRVSSASRWRRRKGSWRDSTGWFGAR